MKKFLLSLLALSLIFGAVYAQDEGVVTPELEIESSVTWGIDLGRFEKAPSTHGFENYTYVDLDLPLYTGNLSKGGDEDVGVQFKLSLPSKMLGLTSGGAEATNDGTRNFSQEKAFSIREVSARLNFFGAYLEVYNHPTFTTDYAYRDWAVVDGGYGLKSIDSGKVGANSRGSIVGYGLTLGYDAKNLGGSDAGLNAALKFASNSNYETLKNQYAVGLDLGFNFGDFVSFKTGVNAMLAKKAFHDFKDEDNLTATSLGDGLYGDKAYLGLGFEVGSKAVDGLDVKFAMDAFPGHGYEGKGAALDFLFDATFKWVNFALFAGNSLAYPSYNDKHEVKGGNMDMRLGFVSDGSDEDTRLVEGLDLEVALHLNDLLNYHDKDMQFPMGLYVGGGYKANLTDSMWIKPHFGLWGETNAYFDKESKSKFGLAYKIGVTYSPLENVEIDAAWSHGGVKAVRGREGLYNNTIDRLYGKETESDISAKRNGSETDEGHKGRFTLGLKLIY